MHTGKWCDWNLQYGDGHCPVSQAVTQSDADKCCTSTNTTGLVHLLVRTVSKAGNLEINFGPAGDGRLPTAMVQPLLGTGRWLQTNGEAIYNTTVRSAWLPHAGQPLSKHANLMRVVCCAPSCRDFHLDEMSQSAQAIRRWQAVIVEIFR